MMQFLAKAGLAAMLTAGTLAGTFSIALLPLPASWWRSISNGKTIVLPDSCSEMIRQLAQAALAE